MEETWSRLRQVKRTFQANQDGSSSGSNSRIRTRAVPNWFRVVQIELGMLGFCSAFAQPWRLPFSRSVISLSQISFPDNSLPLPQLCLHFLLHPRCHLPSATNIHPEPGPPNFLCACISHPQGTTGVIFSLLISRDPRNSPPGTQAPSDHPKHVNTAKHATHPFGFRSCPPEHRVHQRSRWSIWVNDIPQRFPHTPNYLCPLPLSSGGVHPPTLLSRPYPRFVRSPCLAVSLCVPLCCAPAPNNTAS